MHKGIVLKVIKEYAVVLAQDNQHCKLIPKEGMYVGQKIFFFEEDIINISHKQRGIRGLDSDLFRKTVSFSVIAACLLFFFLFGGIQGLPGTDSSYYAVVSVDINPSVELKISKQKYVIAVEALNQEAYQVAGQYLVGLKVEDAVSKIVTNAVKHHYLKDEEAILFSAAVNPAANVSEEDLKHEIITELTSGKLPDFYSYLFIPSTSEDYKEAKRQKLSLGKYQITILANEKLLPQEVQDMKVKDLLQDETIKSKLKKKNQKKDVWIQESKKKEKDNNKGNGKDKQKGIDKKKNGSDEPENSQMVNTNIKANHKDENDFDQENKGRSNKALPEIIPKKSPDPPQGVNPGKQDNQNASKKVSPNTQKNNEPQKIENTPDKDNQGDSGVKGEDISKEKTSSKDNDFFTEITDSNSNKGGYSNNNQSSNSGNSGNSSNNVNGNNCSSGKSNNNHNKESNNK